MYVCVCVCVCVCENTGSEGVPALRPEASERQMIGRVESHIRGVGCELKWKEVERLNQREEMPREGRGCLPKSHNIVLFFVFAGV